MVFVEEGFMHDSALLSKIKGEFRIGDASYEAHRNNLTVFLRREGLVGLQASAEVVAAYADDLEDAMSEYLTSERNSVILEQGNLLAGRQQLSYHQVVATYRGLIDYIHPFNFPCGYHPFIHLHSAVFIVGEQAGQIEFRETIDWEETLQRLFSCLDFWIAFQRERKDTERPGESLIKNLMGSSASVFRLLGRREVPAFLDKIIAGSESLPIYSSEWRVSTITRDSAGRMTQYVDPKPVVTHVASLVSVR
jgi:hypothetical protein